MCLLGVAEQGGGVVAVCVFAFTQHSAEYLFGISAPEGRQYTAPLLWAGATRLMARGIPRLNLGGGVRRDDGIADFKQRFGAKRLPLGALKQVYRPDVYASLSRESQKDPNDRAGFFPPYRAP